MEIVDILVKLGVVDLIVVDSVVVFVFIVELEGEMRDM